MKKLLLGLSVVSVLFFTACKNASSPVSVAEGFAKAMNAQDFEAAKKISTAGSQSFLDDAATTLKSQPIPDSIKTIVSAATYKASNQKMLTDSTCSVDVTVKYGKEFMGKTEDTQPLMLKKEKGEWKVDLQATMEKMMEQFGGGNPQMIDSVGADSTQAATLPATPDSAAK